MSYSDATNAKIHYILKTEYDKVYEYNLKLEKENESLKVLVRDLLHYWTTAWPVIDDLKKRAEELVPNKDRGPEHET